MHDGLCMDGATHTAMTSLSRTCRYSPTYRQAAAFLGRKLGGLASRCTSPAHAYVHAGPKALSSAGPPLTLPSGTGQIRLQCPGSPALPLPSSGTCAAP